MHSAVFWKGNGHRAIGCGEGPGRTQPAGILLRIDKSSVVERFLLYAAVISPFLTIQVCKRSLHLRPTCVSTRQRLRATHTANILRRVITKVFRPNMFELVRSMADMAVSLGLKSAHPSQIYLPIALEEKSLWPFGTESIVTFSTTTMHCDLSNMTDAVTYYQAN